MGETRILPTHDKRNPLVLIPDPIVVGETAVGSGINGGLVHKCPPLIPEPTLCKLKSFTRAGCRFWDQY